MLISESINSAKSEENGDLKFFYVLKKRWLQSLGLEYSLCHITFLISCLTTDDCHATIQCNKLYNKILKDSFVACLSKFTCDLFRMYL